MKKFFKICIFTHTLPRFSGDPSAPFIDELARALVKLGNEVFVLTPYDQKIDKTYKRPYKVIPFKYIFPEKFHILGYSKTLKGDKSMNLIGLILSPLLYFFGFFALSKLVKREKIDIISSHWIIPNGFIAALVSKITKIPFITTIPGSDVYMAGKNFFFKWMTGFAATNASFVVSDSQFYLQQLKDLGIYTSKTKIIPYGVNSKKFTIVKKDKTLLAKLNIKDEEVLLATGRMVAKKGFKYLIEALPEIITRFPKTKLVMIGDGELRKRLEEKVKQIGVENNVIFVGKVAYGELQRYYSLADVFIMPSVKDEKGNIDASPVSLMIAMMSGCPIVATKFALGKSSISQQIGYIVKDKSSKEISKAVISILQKNTNKKVQKEVRKYAIDNFSVIKAARKYISLFRKVVSL
ncbi:MAG: glycosyltransferase [bacterium]